MKHGRNCIAISGIILIICGIAAMVACYSATGVIASTWEKACGAVADLTTCVNLQQLCYDACDEEYAKAANTVGSDSDTREEIKSSCYSSCDEIPDEPYSEEQCQIDLKKEADCVCGDTLESCDCSNSPMDQIENFWETGCLALGAVGLIGCTLLTGIPAVISAFKKVRCCNVMFYSVFCGILCWVFMAAGGVFIAIGMAFQVGPIKEFLDDCENQLAEQVAPDAETTDALDSVGASDAVNDTVDCGAQAFCDGLRVLSDDVYTASMSIGIPFFIAGLFMFFGMYACCCCKKSLPGNDDQVQQAEMVGK